jgi:hypothetical protein
MKKASLVVRIPMSALWVLKLVSGNDSCCTYFDGSLASKSIELSLNKQRLKALNSASSSLETLETQNEHNSDFHSQVLKHRHILEHKIRRLEEGPDLRVQPTGCQPGVEEEALLLLASDEELRDFTHVYRFHSPTVSLSKASRNVC